MSKSVYEIHNLENNSLPIIFHEIRINDRIVTEANWHENIELLYCVSGNGYVYCDSERYEFLQGDLIIANTNVIHSISSAPKIFYYCLIIDSSFCKKIGIDITKIKFNEIIKDSKIPEFFERIKRTHDSFFEDNKIYSSAELQIEILSLLTYLCKNYIEAIFNEKNTVDTSAERIKSTLIYIYENFASDITLDRIASHLKISKYHLSREFKAFTGNTIFETVNLIRCKEAKRLMAKGALVSEAALSCGFENLSYFSRCFKKQYGIAPSKYLKERKK